MFRSLIRFLFIQMEGCQRLLLLNTKVISGIVGYIVQVFAADIYVDGFLLKRMSYTTGMMNRVIRVA